MYNCFCWPTEEVKDVAVKTVLVGAGVVVIIALCAAGTGLSYMHSTRVERVCRKSVENAGSGEFYNRVITSTGKEYRVDDGLMYEGLKEGEVYTFDFTNKYDLAMNLLKGVSFATTTPPPCPKKPA